jgi:3-deoxy-D-manno-octulosonate 8-phosphate phosphatase (KDO 8-P phosphatase)
MKIKLLIIDVDGTLTDGKIYLGLNGEILKVFSVKDGQGISKLKNYNITPIIITGRKSKITEVRAKELGIDELYQNIDNKIDILKKIIERYKCTLNEIAYIGDDENDLECIKICGYTGCPADANESVKNEVDLICRNNGGDGAVREFIEKIIVN